MTVLDELLKDTPPDTDAAMLVWTEPDGSISYAWIGWSTAEALQILQSNIEDIKSGRCQLASDTPCRTN